MAQAADPSLVDAVDLDPERAVVLPNEGAGQSAGAPKVDVIAAAPDLFDLCQSNLLIAPSVLDHATEIRHLQGPLLVRRTLDVVASLTLP